MAVCSDSVQSTVPKIQINLYFGVPRVILNLNLESRICCVESAFAASKPFASIHKAHCRLASQSHACAQHALVMTEACCRRRV